VPVLLTGGGREDEAAPLPLLLSVRSSPSVALPGGMTDTVLNRGINDRSCNLLAKHYNNPR
jgi:hypothetical protein